MLGGNFTGDCNGVLNMPERLQRYKQLKTRSLAIERKLKDAVEKLTLQHGETLEPQMQDDLTSIMEERSNDVQKRLDDFWEQQRMLGKFVGTSTD